MSRHRLLIGFLLLILSTFCWYSVQLALTRMYQVDECQNLYMARILATGQASEFFTNASLFLFGPLSWITKRNISSVEMFGAARIVFLGIFWLNLLLAASIASGRLFSIRGLIALIAAATLAPLWDYGFEVRHDNLVLTGVLLTWWVARTRPMGVPSYVLAAATTVTLLFIAVKAIVYVLPLSFAILVFPPLGHKRPRWQLSLAWISGAVLTAAAIRLCYANGGAWDVYLDTFRSIAEYSTGHSGSSAKFWPWSTLTRLLGQAPLFLALTIAGCIAVAMDLRQRRKAALDWTGSLPEVLLLAGAMMALLANPTPFPYNLVHVVPYAFLVAFKYGAWLWNELQDRMTLRPVVGAIIFFTHLIPFGLATQRHLDRPNFRQEKLMRLAEDLTDPAKDPVYDGVGMVLTRRSIHHQWYLHSLNMDLVNTPGSRVQDMLSAHPATVFIPNYRTDWLSKEAHDFIRKRYIPLADDFWVLGTVLPLHGGSFEVIHPGRYHIAFLHEEKPITGTLDGLPLSGHPVGLAVGIHQIETTHDSQPLVIWVGPRLDQVPQPGPGSHRSLFVNWY